MAYIYTDLITEFRSLMRDPSTLNNKFFTDAEILRWAADANMEMIRELGLHIFTTNLQIVVFDGDLETLIGSGDTDTEIKVDNVTGSVVPPITGKLSIENSAGESQTYNYYTWSEAAGVYTFSVNSTVASYAFAANDTVTIYKGEYPFPTNAIKIVSVYDSLDNKRIFPTTITDLENNDTYWKDRTGEVEFYYPTKEKGTSGENPDIGFYRKPTSARAFNIRSWKLPISSADASSLAAANTPEVEESLCKLLMEFLLGRGEYKRKNFRESDNQYAKFYKVNVPMAKKFFEREEDGIRVLGSNEGQSGKAMGRYPDGYPQFTR